MSFNFLHWVSILIERQKNKITGNSEHERDSIPFNQYLLIAFFSWDAHDAKQIDLLQFWTIFGNILQVTVVQSPYCGQK